MASASALRFDRWRSRELLAVVATCAVALGAAQLVIREPRVALSVAASMLLVALAVRVPRFVLGLLVVWLVGLGMLRRMVSGVAEPGAFGDPLLLVGAVTWVILAVIAVERGALRGRTRLTNAVLALVGALTLSSLNPLQGDASVRLGGLFLVVVPMVAFLVGRTLIDDIMLRRLLWLFAGLGIVAAGYGLFQTLRGMPSWDERWIAESGYGSLRIGDVVRSFASFSAASEYATFVGVAMIALVLVRRRPFPLMLVALGSAVLALGLWYTAVRSVVVFTVAAAGMVVAAKFGLSLVRSVLIGAAVIVGLSLAVGRVAPQPTPDDVTSQLSAHQVRGLSDPFGEGSSLPDHISLVTNGLRDATVAPLGRGVGSVSIAAEKYGGAAAGTESDLGNVAVAAGVFGLVAYAAVVVLGFRRVHRAAIENRDAVHLAALGLLIVTFFQWFNGGQYAVVFVPWLILGWADRLGPDEPADQPTASA